MSQEHVTFKVRVQKEESGQYSLVVYAHQLIGALAREGLADRWMPNLDGSVTVVSTSFHTQEQVDAFANVYDTLVTVGLIAALAQEFQHDEVRAEVLTAIRSLGFNTASFSAPEGQND